MILSFADEIEKGADSRQHPWCLHTLTAKSRLKN
jgi:hypothetical protein